MRITALEKTTMIPMKATNHGPTSDSTNEWIEDVMPDRVRNVPRIESAKTAEIRQTFQTFSMPFFSCTITECRKAVPTSHGISAAFSTGSQPQKPPQPTDSYAHFAPSRMPTPRNPQAASVKRRVVRIQRSSVRPASSADMA